MCVKLKTCNLCLAEINGYVNPCVLQYGHYNIKIIINGDKVNVLPQENTISKFVSCIGIYIQYSHCCKNMIPA